MGLNDAVNVMEVLLEQGADTNVVTSDGETALSTAASWGRPSQVALLLEHGASIDPSTREGLRPLRVAIKKLSFWTLSGSLRFNPDYEKVIRKTGHHGLVLDRRNIHVQELLSMASDKGIEVSKLESFLGIDPAVV